MRLSLSTTVSPSFPYVYFNAVPIVLLPLQSIFIHSAHKIQQDPRNDCLKTMIVLIVLFSTSVWPRSLRALWAYLRSQGISPAPVWSSIKDVVVKTAISTEAAFNTAINAYCNHPCSVHEVFGFDILLDEDLQPWLLEVNVSPRCVPYILSSSVSTDYLVFTFQMFDRQSMSPLQMIDLNTKLIYQNFADIDNLNCDQ